jgi:hypothetical protein
MTMLKFRDYIKEMSESEKHAARSNLILLLQHTLHAFCTACLRARLHNLRRISKSFGSRDREGAVMTNFR